MPISVLPSPASMESLDTWLLSANASSSAPGQWQEPPGRRCGSPRVLEPCFVTLTCLPRCSMCCLTAPPVPWIVIEPVGID